jgi:predicted DNA-binding transcriptional regulator YafY
MKRKQSLQQIRWDLALRYRLIETVAWWEGRLTTNHLMQSFGISRQQASKDINTYLSDYAPGNLTYDKHLKGYRPADGFEPRFIDGSASAYLHLLNQNHDRAPHIEGLALAYAHTQVLQVPDRSIRPEVLRPILQACREQLRLETEYVSFSTPNVEIRVMVPHTLVYTGMRWHLRAYCEKHRDYRDFVLSRFRGEPDLMDASEQGPLQDAAWNTSFEVQLMADPRLSPEQQQIIETDYGMHERRLVIPTRGALVQYILQRYQIDPLRLQDKAEAQQLVVANLDALRPWLYS